MQQALITGATSGIGEQFAIKLAEQGYNLILTGRRREIIYELKKKLEKKYKIKVKIILVDFSNKNQFEKLVKYVKKQNINFLINNAGFGNHTGFFNNKLETEFEMINTHIDTIVTLTHIVGQKMIEKKKGTIINVSTLSSFFPIYRGEIYSSTKAFIRMFTESIHFELKKHGIKIQCLCPGFTRTNFHKRKNVKKAEFFWMTPEKVVKLSLKNINKIIYIPGFRNRILYYLSRILPRKLIYFCINRFN